MNGTTSKAYIISEVEIADREAAERYKELAAASIAAHGGRYVVRGAAPEVLEGERGDERLVVVEFDDVASAQTWYASPEYAPALTIARRGALRRRLTLVDGV
ncbi:hypothetical protein DSM104299_03006 [Baekduia alba]|uniref:DUF1330 domain-containing protein n=1 Tax=Baekduia alba TaxID=2997333 RepID=UPI002341FF81|nr:DUF1330 domain-containing protein [Baekduia alba]WCB94274.1 hypothetical protein DSM104299_03006 [Baekduia alba]